MAAGEADRLRRLSAELTAEVERVVRAVDEIDAALGAVREPKAGRIVSYGAAALLDSFYTGIEKALVRVASFFGGVPQGATWHRSLLEDAVLDVPEVRPAVLREGTARALEPYLAFRHRFRNLYMFDLEVAQLLPLLVGARAASTDAGADLRRFAATLIGMAGALEVT